MKKLTHYLGKSLGLLGLSAVLVGQVHAADFTVGGQLNTGSIKSGGALTVQSNGAYIIGGLGVNGDVNIQGGMTMTGTMNSNDIKSSGALTVRSNGAAINGGLGVTGTTNLFGALNATGLVTGTGGFEGNLIGNVTGNTAGVHTGAVTGAVTGNVTGNLTGNVTTDSINATASNVSLHIGESTDVVILGASDSVTNVAGDLQVVGSMTGNLTGNASGTAATVTGAAQSAITSVGTLTGLSVSGTLAVTGAPAGDGTGAINADSSISTTGTGVYAAANKGRLTLGAGFGSSTDLALPSAGLGVWGKVAGANLTGESNFIAGTVGTYGITGTNASKFYKVGLLGSISSETTSADAAVMALLDGDSGLTHARAGYGIMTLNSTGGSGFDYGMDLKIQVVPGLESEMRPFKKADIRLSRGQEVYSGDATTRAAVIAQAGTQGVVGSVYLSSAGKMYLKVAADGAVTDWNLVTATAAD